MGKKFNVLSLDNFNAITQAQAQLNEKYSGKDWAVKIPKSHFLSAMMAELGELLESSPRTGDTETGWKWWKPTIDNDINNMKIEAVDIIHFAKSVLILCYESDLNQLMTDYNACSTTFREEEENLMNENSTGVSEDLISSLAVFTLSSMQSDREEVLNIYMFVVDALCRYADMTTDEIYELYMKKNELNFHRVENGYQEGTYQKYDEYGNEDNTKLFKK